MTAAIRHHFVSFDLVDGDVEVAIAFRWAGEPSYPRLAALARGIVDAVPRTIAAGKPLFVIVDGDVAQTLGGILKEELKVASEVLVLDGIWLWDFDYIDLGRVRMPSFTVPVTIKSLVFTADPAHSSQAPPRHEHGTMQLAWTQARHPTATRGGHRRRYATQRARCRASTGSGSSSAPASPSPCTSR